MSKQSQLDDLKEKLLKDENIPLKSTATNLVFGSGNPDNGIYLLGEAPGRQEDLTGLPFVGSAGKFLDHLLKNAGLERKDVYITSVLKYRPPKNRDPKPEEIAAFAPYVDKEIQIISPKIIITLGRFSLNKFLPEAKISNVHGQPQKIEYQGLNLTLIPMYHPAAAIYRQYLKKVLEEDFKKIVKLL